jgi:transcriptional regulator with XRE-family HTH domain
MFCIALCSWLVLSVEFDGNAIMKTGCGSRGVYESQAQLAKCTGISQTHIGNILGQRKAASIDLLESLANRLSCEPWLLLAPINLMEDFGQLDFTPLIYCYSRLNPSDQNTIWDMTHQLYEATNGIYSR